MRCETCRELLSAVRDGEASDAEAEAARRHRERCAPCARYARSLERLGRLTALRPAEPVPDLTGPILEAVPPVGVRPALGLRAGLAAVAVALLAVSVQCLVAGAGPGHASHHLAMWDAAFAVGLLVVVARPERARGLVPVGVALVTFMVVANLLERHDGTAGSMSLVAHVLEGTAALGLWALSRRPVAAGGDLGPGAPGAPWEPAAGSRRGVPSKRWEVVVTLVLLVAGATLVATTPRAAEGRVAPTPSGTPAPEAGHTHAP
jgi:predicted anti-sigma-YlaC factor YlaD